MARLPIDKARLSRLAGRSVARYIDLVHRTSRVILEPPDVGAFLDEVSPAIVAVWHGQFLMAPQAKPLEVPLAIMLARHGDAQLFAEALERFNTTLIRGAGAGARRKDRGGAYALRAAIASLENGISVGMTADVPPGPARVAGIGIVTLAKHSGRPIVPLAAATSRFRTLGTWSRMTINLPYGTLACVYGEPIHVAKDATPDEIEAARIKVEAGLDAVTARAYQLVGADIGRVLPRFTTGRRGTDRAWEPAEPGAGLRTYRLATRALQPAAPLILGLRERRGKEEGARRGERLGKPGKARPAGRLIWIHAASVGELNAVLPLADALRAARPNISFLFTTVTITSAQIAERRLQAGDVHQFAPLDAPGFIGRFLDHWRPDAVLLTESEIWPNTILQCSERRIPLVLVNARMSVRSFERWRRRQAIARPLFSRFDLVLAQNDEIADRFREIGAQKVITVGNLKIDAPPLPIDDEARRQLTAALEGRPFWVAASTHDGEEQIVVAAHRAIAARHPGLVTIIAPRHPERGIGIAEMVKAAGLTPALRSLGALPTVGTDVYIADTIGELGTLYALAPFALIGGSLVARGGQNPIEAIRLGAAVLSGPHWSNFDDAYAALVRDNAVNVVHTAEDLAAAADRLISDAVELRRSKAAAQLALERLSGAIGRSVAALVPFVPGVRELAGAG